MIETYVRIRRRWTYLCIFLPILAGALLVLTFQVALNWPAMGMELYDYVEATWPGNGKRLLPLMRFPTWAATLVISAVSAVCWIGWLALLLVRKKLLGKISLQRPNCPRCRYDLSGLFLCDSSGHVYAFPQTTRCPECGLLVAPEPRG